MAQATFSISSRNYGSWSLRGWLLCKLAGIDFEPVMVDSDDPSVRAELLLLSPSFLVPCLTHDGRQGVGHAGDRRLSQRTQSRSRAACRANAVARAHCRSISGEMHSGFSNLRSALPMNLKAHYPGFKVWAGAQADIDRIVTIWSECLDATMAARSCSANGRAWRTPCMRRSARAFAPMTSSSTRRARPIARPSWRCR